MQSVAAIISYLEQFAPRSLAEDWDNVGLLLGDRASKIDKILTCLTITPEVVQEAIKLNAGLIVTHHPILFRSVKRLTTDNPDGRMLLALIQAGIAVYSPHTAFDNTQDGINEMLAQRLGLINVEPLRNSPAPSHCKIVVFVPESDLSSVSNAMFKAGAGHIGEYSECSFRIQGTGTFHGSESTNPTIGTKGQREEVAEQRLELICPERRVDAVLKAMIQAHSYEEPAYDVYPLRSGQDTTMGSGRKGILAESMTLADLTDRLKQSLKCGPIQVVGDVSETVETVAIVCGAGGEMLSDAIRARVDVFLTGEMRFHDYLRAKTEKVALCLPGHYATERFALEELAKRLQAEFSEVQCMASQAEVDPVTWI